MEKGTQIQSQTIVVIVVCVCRVRDVSIGMAYVGLFSLELYLFYTLQLFDNNSFSQSVSVSVKTIKVMWMTTKTCSKSSNKRKGTYVFHLVMNWHREWKKKYNNTVRVLTCFDKCVEPLILWLQHESAHAYINSNVLYILYQWSKSFVSKRKKKTNNFGQKSNA